MIFNINRKQYGYYNSLRARKEKKYLCHAPFKNLLFAQGGKIMACHFNRGHILGIYPQNTLAEIVAGKPLQLLRKKLKHYEFPESCWYCKNEIENTRFYQAGCKKYDYLSGFGSAKAFVSAEFQMSNICNLECVMCSGEYSSMIRKNREAGEPFFDPYDDKFVEQLIPLLPHLKFASFTGGEPFLNPLYYKIWNLIQQENPNIKITISTNGTILNDKIKLLFDSLDMELTVSVDTLDRNSYNLLRKNADFEVTMNNINYFLTESVKRDRIFSVKCVIMKQNIEQIPELFEFFNSKNVQIYPKLIWAPLDLSLRYATATEFDEYISVLKTSVLMSTTDMQKFNCLRYYEIISTLEKWKEESSANSRGKLIACSSSELMLQIRGLLTDFVCHDGMISDVKRNTLLNQIEDLISYITAMNKTEEEKRQMLSGLLSLPRHMIINEFYRMNPEMFIYRLIKI